MRALAVAVVCLALAGRLRRRGGRGDAGWVDRAR